MSSQHLGEYLDDQAPVRVTWPTRRGSRGPPTCARPKINSVQLNPDMQVAVVGLTGALAGGPITATTQVLISWRTAVTAARTALREDRKRIYVDSLWSLRAVRDELRISLLQEQNAAQRGESFTPPPPDAWNNLQRVLLEASLLGDTRVHQELASAAQSFRDWVMSLDADAPVRGFAEVDSRLNAIVSTLRSTIRKDLQVD